MVLKQLHDESHLVFVQLRFDGAHSPLVTGDLDPFAYLKRPVSVQMARCYHLVGVPQLVAIVDPSHREARTIRARRESGRGTA